MRKRGNFEKPPDSLCQDGGHRQGRYVVPDLPKAKYKVWVRGYGLVDSPKVDGEPRMPPKKHPPVLGGRVLSASELPVARTSRTPKAGVCGAASQALGERCDVGSDDSINQRHSRTPRLVRPPMCRGAPSVYDRLARGSG